MPGSIRGRGPLDLRWRGSDSGWRGLADDGWRLEAGAVAAVIVIIYLDNHISDISNTKMPTLHGLDRIYTSTHTHTHTSHLAAQIRVCIQYIQVQDKTMTRSASPNDNDWPLRLASARFLFFPSSTQEIKSAATSWLPEPRPECPAVWNSPPKWPASYHRLVPSPTRTRRIFRAPVCDT